MPNTTKIKTRCPHCGSTFKVAEMHIGKMATCPVKQCGQKFQVEAVADAPKDKPHPKAKKQLNTDNPYVAEFELPTPPKTGLTLSETYASHPGRLKVNWLRWFRHMPKWPSILGGSLAACCVLMYYFPGILSGLALFLSAGMCFLYWLRVGNHFRFGCANTAVVVSIDPMMIAVSTNLSNDGGEFHVIKIVEIKINKSAGKKLEIGSYLPTVSLYAPPPDGETRFWANFFPVPADYVTSDANEIKRLLAGFDASDFVELEQHLAFVSKPYEPGLYLMWPAPNEKIGRRAPWLDE